MGALTVPVTDAQYFLHDMLLPAMSMAGFGRHLFLVETVALKGMNTAIAKESYLGVGQFKIPLRKGTECPTIDFFDLKLVPGGNYQTEAAFPTRVILRHTIPTGSALASQRLSSGAMGAVVSLATAARWSIEITMTAPGLPVPRSTSSAHGPPNQWWRHEGGFNFRSDYAFRGTHDYARAGNCYLATTPAMPTAAMAAEGSEHLAPAPGTSEPKHLAPVPGASERARHASRAIHHRDGSRFHRLADRLRHLQDQQRHLTTNLQRSWQDRERGIASARQHRHLRPRDASGAWKLPLHDHVLRPLHQVRGGIHHLNKEQGADNSGQIFKRLHHASRTSFLTLTC